MANRDNHYEAAFEEYLRRRQVPYVAVDESRRSLLGDGSLKSLDFIISPPAVTADDMAAETAGAAAGGSWLVDVKGRLFPSGSQRTYWKNWSTRDDLWSLAEWQHLFGDRFRSLFVFAYRVVADRAPLPPEQLFSFRGRCYGFVGIRLCDYVRFARPISTAWDTVAMPARHFRRLAAPVERFF